MMIINRFILQLLRPPVRLVKSDMACPLITPDKELIYEDIVKMTNNDEIILIDVREPSELSSKGAIPKAINIPMNEVAPALKDMTPADFKKKYGIDKPAIEAAIVFSCGSGNRSARVLTSVLELGYKNARHYKGGYGDWAQNHKG